MKAISIMLVACMCIMGVNAQPFSVGQSSINLTDETRNNRQIPIEIFYPATSSGTDVPVAGNGSGFPVVVFGHGFLINTSSYNWLGQSCTAKSGSVRQ